MTIAYIVGVRPARLFATSLLVALAACGGDDPGYDEQDVVLDTESEQAWAQYQANLAFAKSYVARCDASAAEGADHRVLVSGYGRFMSTSSNATGEMVSELIEELTYPMTDSPPFGEIDPPGPQLAVAQGTIDLPGAGTVAVCAMVLPVYWDLAPWLVAQEMAAFEPDMVLMNGIAGGRQSTWLEMGAINRASGSRDGSNITRVDEAGAPLIPGADASEYARPNLASWEPMKAAMQAALAEHESVEHDGLAFGDVVRGIELAGYPRSSNTYLCNNVTYTVGYLMDHWEDEVTLMEASHVREGADAGLPITLGVDMSEVPRLFMHWSSQIRGEHLQAGTAMLRAAIDTQLTLLDDDESGPIRGDNAIADRPGDSTGGDTF